MVALGVYDSALGDALYLAWRCCWVEWGVMLRAPHCHYCFVTRATRGCSGFRIPFFAARCVGDALDAASMRIPLKMSIYLTLRIIF